MLFVNYPEICQISANITNIKIVKEKTYLTLDKTIFLPTNRYLVKEEGEIAGKKVEGVFERSGKIFHLVDGRLERGKVDLYVQKNQRLTNLSYNTAYFLFQGLFDNLYNRNDLSFSLDKGKGRILVNDFDRNFDKTSFEDLANYLIRGNLKVERSLNEKNLPGLFKVKNPIPCFSRTGRIYGVEILSSSCIDDKLLLEFITGEDFLAFQESNKKLLEDIESLTLKEGLSSQEKIRKIINKIEEN